MGMGMLIEYIYIPLILFMYYRTWGYKHLIDDPVPRDGYLYELPRVVDASWYERRRSVMATVVNIGVFLAVCGWVHVLFGWKAAVLFAVMPLNVSGVAWITGNYYMSTMLLTLAALGCMMSHTVIGIIASTLFYGAALNSTLSAVPFIIPALFFPLGWLNAAPLIAFMTGKRLRTGLKKRRERHAEQGIVVGKWSWGQLIHMPKVVAYYLFLSVWPTRLGFFHTYGKQNFYSKAWFTALCSLACVGFIAWGVTVNWMATLCWVVFIGIYSQFIVFGQHVTERYTLVANVFMCVLLASAIGGSMFWVLATLWFCRSMTYIPAWKDDATLFSYSLTQFPTCPENYINLASYYIQRKDWVTAIKPLLMAERLVVGNKYGIWVDLSNCYGSCGHYGKAMEYTLKALEVAPLDKVLVMEKQRNDINNRLVVIEKNRKQLQKMGVLGCH